jgi:hypothetical protein
MEVIQLTESDNSANGKRDILTILTVPCAHRDAGPESETIPEIFLTVQCQKC